MEHQKKIPLDILDAATIDFMQRHTPSMVQYTRDALSPGLVIFKLRNEHTGDMGQVRLRKLAEKLTSLSIVDPTHPTKVEAIEYILRQQERKPYTEMNTLALDQKDVEGKDQVTISELLKMNRIKLEKRMTDEEKDLLRELLAELRAKGPQDESVTFIWFNLKDPSRWVKTFMQQQLLSRCHEILYRRRKDLQAQTISAYFDFIKESAIEELTKPEQSVSPDALAKVPATTQAHESFVFRKVGDIWNITFHGGQLQPIKHLKGMEYIAFLLRHMGKDFGILELVSAVEGKPIDSMAQRYSRMSEEELEEEESSMRISRGDEGFQRYDKMTEENLKSYLKQLSARREEARRDHDSGEEAKIDEETAKINDYLKRGRKRGGGIRSEGSIAEGERTRVAHLIDNAISHMEQYDQDLAKHLRKTIKIQRAGCEYRPDIIAPWKT